LLFQKAVLSRRPHHPLYFSLLFLNLYKINTLPGNSIEDKDLLPHARCFGYAQHDVLCLYSTLH
jgi:hypothetical protein